MDTENLCLNSDAWWKLWWNDPGQQELLVQATPETEAPPLLQYADDIIVPVLVYVFFLLW